MSDEPWGEDGGRPLSHEEALRAVADLRRALAEREEEIRRLCARLGDEPEGGVPLHARRRSSSGHARHGESSANTLAVAWRSIYRRVGWPYWAAGALLNALPAAGERLGLRGAGLVTAGALLVLLFASVLAWRSRGATYGSARGPRHVGSDGEVTGHRRERRFAIAAATLLATTALLALGLRLAELFAAVVTAPPPD